jgi:hypothetical protein
VERVKRGASQTWVCGSRDGVLYMAMNVEGNVERGRREEREEREEREDKIDSEGRVGFKSDKT